MSSIWSGSIHCEINDFDVKSICQYAQSMCRGPYTFAKYTFLSGKKLPQKTVNGILTSSTTQCHDIDISYIDIDIGKNAFSMASLVVTSQCSILVVMSQSSIQVVTSQCLMLVVTSQCSILVVVSQYSNSTWF